MASPRSGRNISGSSAGVSSPVQKELRSAMKSAQSSQGRSSPTSVRVIQLLVVGISSPKTLQEIFQDYNELGYKQALQELDLALEEKCAVIVIEPMRLGNETARYIGIGNFLHKATVLLGSSSLLLTGIWPRRWHYWSVLAGGALLTFALYTADWRTDPACKYQVETNEDNLSKLNINHLNTSSVVVLVYRNDQRRKILHSTVTTAVVLVFGVKLWNYFRSL